MTSPVTATAAITDSKFTTGKRTIPGADNDDDDDDDGGGGGGGGGGYRVIAAYCLNFGHFAF